MGGRVTRAKRLRMHNRSIHLRGRSDTRFGWMHHVRTHVLSIHLGVKMDKGLRCVKKVSSRGRGIHCIHRRERRSMRRITRTIRRRKRRRISHRLRVVRGNLAEHIDSIHGRQITRWGRRKGRITIALSLSFGALGIQKHRSMRRHYVSITVEKSGVRFGRIQCWVVL